MSDINITVTDDTIDGFEYAATISDVADIGRYFRMSFNAQNPEPWKHADDVILDIIRRNPQQVGQDVEEYNEVILDKMSEFEPQELPDQSVQETVNTTASDLEKGIEETADILNRDTTLLEILRTIDVADKTTYMGPITVYTHMLKMMKDGFDFFGRIAEPGTHKDHVIGSNKPYDKYSKYVATASGSRKAKSFSQIDEIALRLSPVATAVKSADEHKVEIAKKQLEALHKADKAADDKTKTIIKRNFRQAVGIIHKLHRMDNLRLLRAKVFSNQDATARTTPKPIHIWEVDDATKAGAFTIVQFLSFNPAKLSPNATLEDLIGSAKGRDTEEGKSKEYPVPVKTEQLFACFNAAASALQNAEMMAQITKHIRDNEFAEFRSAMTIIEHQLELIDNVYKATAKTAQDKLLAAANKQTA